MSYSDNYNKVVHYSCFLLIRTKNKELVELRTYNIADQSDIYEIIDNEQDESKDESFSEIKFPSTTDKANTQGKVEGLSLSPCPAYLPVDSPSAEIDVDYEIVNPTYSLST